MPTIKKFEDLEFWQKARELSRKVNTITNESPLNKDYSLKDQIRRSSGSIMDNIAEGFERSGNREFIQFLSIAKSSAGEVQSQLYRLLDQEYIDQQTFDGLYKLCGEIGKMIMGLIKYLNKTEYKGDKFNNRMMEDPTTYFPKKPETRN